MRKLLYVLILSSWGLQAQKQLVLVHPSAERLEQEDRQRALEGTFPRCAVGIPVSDYDLSRLGTWERTPDGRLQWSLEISVPGARGLALYFSNIALREHERLTVRAASADHSETITTAEVQEGAGWLTEFYPSDALRIIYECQGTPHSFPDIHLEQVVVAYRMLHFPLFPKNYEKDFGDADACQVNVRCSPEGDNWQDQRRAVVRILLKEGNSYGWCSGALINNTAQDCTPFVLTANHCGAGASPTDFRSWKFYFNYEAAGCANPPGEGTLATQTVTGSMKVASSSDNSSIFRSDFLLTLLKIRPPASYNAYLAGWSTSNTGSPSGVGIHHPGGDIKKISTYTQTLLSTTWGGTPGTHWQVKWAATPNGHGVTEEGSSGSPIFNNAKLIVGQLSGGSSFCTQPNNPDAYGKFWYNWDQTGTAANRRLKDWLDRNNTNPTTLSGRNNTCSSANLPTVDFVADQTNVQAGQVVSFTDLTTNNPFAWTWQISPSTFSFTDGTNANSKNPKVVFNAQGNYNITLTAGNTAGYETRVKTAYIKVTGNISVPGEQENPLAVSFFPNPASDFLQFTADWNKTGLLHARILDAAGRCVQTGTLSRESPFLVLNFTTEGLYVLRVESDNGQVGFFKFLKIAP